MPRMDVRKTHKTTGRGTESSDEFRQSVELGLQRSDFAFGSERHHQSTVKGSSTDGNDDVFSDTFGDFGTREQETVLLGLFAFFEGRSFGNTVIVGELFDQVGFTSSSGFVALDVVTSQKDAIDGNNLSGFENADITDDDVLERDQRRVTGRKRAD